MRRESGTRTVVRALVTLWAALCAALCAAQVAAEVVLSTSVDRVVGGDRRSVEAGVSPGDVLRYTISFTNQGTQTARAGTIVITNPLPEGTEYVDGSAGGAGTVVTFSVDGERFAAPESLMVQQDGASRVATAGDYRSIRWTFRPALSAGESGEVSFDLRIR